MTLRNARRMALGLLWIAGLAACGGGAEGRSPGTQPSAPSDPRLTLQQYQAGRPPPAGPVTSSAALSAESVTGAVTLLRGPSGNAISVPALPDGLRTLLLSAAQGDTLAQIQTHWPDPGARSAATVRRELWAHPQARFLPSFLQASDRGAPLLADWQARGAATALELQPNWPPGTPVSELEMDAGSSLLVIDQLDVQLPWPTGSSTADGLFQFEGGALSIVKLRSVPGERWELQGSDWQAEGLNLPQARLIRLQPKTGRLEDFVRQGLSPALAEVLQKLHQGLRTQPGVLRLPEGKLPKPGWNLGLPAAVSLPFDKTRGELSQIDGTPSFARLAKGEAELESSERGLRLRAGYALALAPRAGPPQWPVAGVFTQITFPGVSLGCPDLGAPLRSHVLVWLDLHGRLVGLVALRVPSEDRFDCMTNAPPPPSPA